MWLSSCPVILYLYITFSKNCNFFPTSKFFCHISPFLPVVLSFFHKHLLHCIEQRPEDDDEVRHMDNVPPGMKCMKVMCLPCLLETWSYSSSFLEYFSPGSPLSITTPFKLFYDFSVHADDCSHTLVSQFFI